MMYTSQTKILGHGFDVYSKSQNLTGLGSEIALLK